MSRHERRRRAFQERLGATLAAVAAGEPDPRNASNPLTMRERLSVTLGIHDVLYLVTRVTGMRHRLRCPQCTAVGTRKPHGGWVDWLWDSPQDRRTGFYGRRWGCKWCGYWISAHAGRQWCYPSTSAGSWAGPGHDPQREPTPAEVLHEHAGKVWPWRG